MFAVQGVDLNKVGVLNICYVLLTRGIDRIRLGFWKNDGFREYMEKTLGIETGEGEQ